MTGFLPFLRCSLMALSVCLPATLPAGELLFELDFRDGLKSNPPLVLPVEERGEGSGGPTDAPRGDGQAWMFDGACALEITLPDPGLLEFGGGDLYTIEAWVRLERDKVTGPIVSKGSGASYRLSVTRERAAAFSYYAEGGWHALVAENMPLPLREWTHVAAQYNGSEQVLMLIVNGQLAVVRQLETPPKAGSGTSLFIGGFTGNGGTRGLVGAVGEVRIFSGLKYPQAADAEVGATLFHPAADD